MTLRPPAPVLALEGLSKSYGALAVTVDVSLDVRAGEIHALIGPNGAGKTTLVGQVAGTIVPDRGHIRFAGADITRRPAAWRARAGLARSFQITSLIDGLSAGEMVDLALRGVRGTGTRLWRRPAEEASHAVRTTAVLERVGLGPRRDHPVSSLSHGERRLLDIALAMALEPRLLVLDEPLAGTGPDEAARLVELIAGLKREAAILLVEHDMSAVFTLADRISVLVEGRLIASGSADIIRADPAVQAAYLGSE
jgi:branched-chain amino acid transport system ATP-binding protein